MSHRVALIPEKSQLTINHPHRKHRLGRHVHFDERSLKHRMPLKAAPLVSKTWERKIPPLDQGDTSSCTGNALVGCLATAPIDQDGLADNIAFDENLALKVYALATQLDSIVGTYPPDDTGSTVLAAQQAAQKLGLTAGYKWCLGLDDVLQTLSFYGPVQLGTGWYEGFFDPDANGQIRISGDLAGGHSYEANGIDVERKLVWCTNSWGSDWSVGGRFSISWDDLGTLLSQDGEAAHPILASSPLAQQPNFLTRAVNCVRNLLKKSN